MPVKALARPVALAEIKALRPHAKIALVRQPRLSVMPLDADAYEKILSLAAR